MSQQPGGSNSLERIGLWLEPLDVLFFRDGRPFSAATRVRSGQPMPQTLAGAIWTALLRQAGCHFPTLMSTYRNKTDRAHWEENLPEEEIRQRTKQAWEEAILQAGGPEWIFQVQVRGPWLAKLREKPPKPSAAPQASQGEDLAFRYPELAQPNGTQSLDIFVPMPAVLYRPKGKKPGSGTGELFYAKPLPASQIPPGWKPPAEGLRPVWVRSREDMELAGGYLCLEGLARFLRAQVPDPTYIMPESELFDYDHRTGIGIEMDRLTSEESQIYAITLLALKKGVGFYAEVCLPPEGAKTLRQIHVLRWGGESRNVLCQPVETPCGWPRVPPANGQKPMLLLTTPGLFAQGWRPACLATVLVAAAVPGESAVSGWDLARGGPKPARFAAASGSVYFLEKLPELLPDCEQLPEPLPKCLSDLEEDRQQGWGCYAEGVWTDE